MLGLIPGLQMRAQIILQETQAQKKRRNKFQMTLYIIRLSFYDLQPQFLLYNNKHIYVFV